MATHHDKHDETERDPWLQQALHHAPDADGRPGAAVREAVLRRAREAVATPPWWQRWWSAWNGASTRPLRLGYSGALIALVVVVVWAPWKVDEELRRVHEEAPPRSAAPAAVAQDPTAPAMAAQSVPPTVPAQHLPSAVTALSPPQPAEPALSSDPAARPKTLERAAAKPGTRPPDAALALPSPPQPQPQAAKAEAVPTVAPAAAPSPPLRTEPPPAAPAAAPPAPPPAAPDPARASLGQPRTLSGAAEGVRDTQASTSATARSAALSAAAPLRLDPLSQTPDLADRWQRWTRGERSGDAGPAQRDWLQRLRAASAGCWMPAPANGLAAPSRTLRFLAGEQTIAAAFVDPDGLLWWNSGALWWRCNDRAAAGALDEAMRW